MVITESAPRRLTRRKALILLTAAATELAASACDSDVPVKTREVPKFTDESFRNLGRQEALNRLEQLRQARPDCVIEPTQTAVDNEIEALVIGKRTYTPLQLPAESRAANLVEADRKLVDEKLKTEASKLRLFLNPIVRAQQLAVSFRLFSNAEDLAAANASGDRATNMRDLAACHSAKAQSLLIYLILNTNPVVSPTHSKV